MISRRGFLQAGGCLATLVAADATTTACTSASPPAIPAADRSISEWLVSRPTYIAHHGGDADWVSTTAAAYRRSAAWNDLLALEAPVWQTSDGVWVLSETASTTPLFGADHNIPTTSWATLSRLRTVNGHHPMARLVEDILMPYARERILFVDNKGAQDPSGLLALLHRFGGPRRIVIKSYWQSRAMPTAAHQAGYRTWGYYYGKDMANFAGSQVRYSMLGLDYTAPTADFRTMLATGKPVIAHIIATDDAAREALAKGATGLMVSGVTQVVPRRR